MQWIWGGGGLLEETLAGERVTASLSFQGLGDEGGDDLAPFTHVTARSPEPGEEVRSHEGHPAS